MPWKLRRKCSQGPVWPVLAPPRLGWRWSRRPGGSRALRRLGPSVEQVLGARQREQHEPAGSPVLPAPRRGEVAHRLAGLGADVVEPGHLEGESRPTLECRIVRTAWCTARFASSRGASREPGSSTEVEGASSPTLAWVPARRWDAHDQRVLRHRDPDVLEGARSASLPCALRRARSDHRHPRAPPRSRRSFLGERWLWCSSGPLSTGMS